MLLEQFIYYAKRMLRFLPANPSGASATFVVLTMFLFMLGAYHTGHATGRHLFPAWVEHGKAVVYLDPRTSVQDLDELARELGKWQEIREVKVISAQDGIKRLREGLGEWKDVLGSIPEGDFPPSLEIGLSDKPRSESEMGDLFAKIRQYPQVEEVFYGKSLAEKLEFFLAPIRLWGIGTTGLLCFLALLMAYHSTMVVLHARREEIEICTILGATPLFTRGPLYMESVFCGLASGMVASVCLACAVSWLKTALPMPVAVALPSQGVHAFFVSVGLTGCGVVLSVSGRWLAFKRAMKTVDSHGDSSGEHVQDP